MQMMQYAEQGSLQMLWISATNPAVSLPELERVRTILGQERLFLVVQDIFPTEKVELADVVLQAAAWGGKTGTFTNTDRAVHISEQAVQQAGEATSDLAIFLDYAQRMGFRDKWGDPLPPWRGPEEAFEAWKQCAADRPCDYSGITYDTLRGGSGIQWPCNESAPEGTERLYADGTFWSAPEYCESHGKADHRCRVDTGERRRSVDAPPGSGPALAPTNTAAAPRSRSVAATYGGTASVATETIPGAAARCGDSG